MTRALIVSTARTGLAKSFRGGFNLTHGAALGGHVIKAAVDTFKEVAIDDFKSENYERAVKHLTVALSLDEKSHVLYSNRCTAYIALEQYERAMEDADECVRLQPTWAKGYLRRGSVYFRKGELERAERVLKEGLELDPGNDALKKELEAVMTTRSHRTGRLT